jgi:Domain of unknown function (DUF5655)
VHRRPARTALRIGPGARITHRVEITSPAQIDAEVGRWLKAAYDLEQ